MRTAAALSLALIATAAAAAPLSNSMPSAALGIEARWNAIVPEDAAPTDRFPVLYVLHGAYGGADDWIRNSAVEEIAADYRMILVFPDGGQFGWYVDGIGEGGTKYETHVVAELIPLVDATLPTVAARDARGIMGLSMGGHGAITLAAKHPDLFASASSTSGILDLTAHPESWEIPARLGPLAENRAAWEANSAVHLAERFRTASVRLLADCGTDDVLGRQTGALEDGRAFHARLVELGVPHVWREFPGGHSWQYWGTRLPEHLDFHQAAMAAHSPGLGEVRTAKFRALDEELRTAAEATIAPPPPPAATPAASVP